ncbi:hypothetical protein ACVNF4_05885 [Streptomyces sp. S6]
MTHIDLTVDAPTLDFTVTNPNDRSIDLSSATVPGESAFSYADGTCGARLAARSSCKVTVEFSPHRLGADSDRLTITSGGTTVTAGLRGTGYVGFTVVLLAARGDLRMSATDPSAGEVCSGFTSSECHLRVTASPTFKGVITDPTLNASPKQTFVTKWSGACTSNPCVPVIAPDDTSTATASFAPDIR